jgi:hypothetical protein
MITAVKMAEAYKILEKLYKLKAFKTFLDPEEQNLVDGEEIHNQLKEIFGEEENSCKTGKWSYEEFVKNYNKSISDGYKKRTETYNQTKVENSCKVKKWSDEEVVRLFCKFIPESYCNG